MEETILSKDTINVTIHDDHSFDCSIVTIGRAGENDITQLEITVPEELNGFWAYLDFKKPNGEKFKTSRLEIMSNIIEFNVPSSMLDKTGNLEVQLVLQNETGEIWKSNIRKFVVLSSIDATEDIPFQEDFITVAQKTLEEIKAQNSITTNALKTTQKGNKISLYDVSPITHELKIKLTSDTITDFSNVTVTRQQKNLLSLPYTGNAQHTENNSISVDEYGKVIFSGTVNTNETMKYVLYEGVPFIETGIIDIGLKKTSGKTKLVFVVYDKNGVGKTQFSTMLNTPQEINLNTALYMEATKWSLYLEYTNTTSNAVTINDVLEPYIFLHSDVTVISVKANADGTVNGIYSGDKNTELVTDNNEVVIECEYSKDINTVEVKTDDILLPDSTNPVQNRALYELLTVKNLISKKSPTANYPLSISNALNSSALEVSIKQTSFPSTVTSANKYPTKDITREFWDSNSWIDISNTKVKPSEKAIFSFNNIDASIVNVLLYSSDYMEFTGDYPILAEVNVQTTDTGRYYIEINNTFDFAINGIVLECYSPPTLGDCALRFDDSTEYTEYTESKIIYDTTTVSVTEITTGKSVNADENGIVNGFVYSADGADMKFYVSNSAFTLDIIYRRSLADEIADLKAQLTSAVSTLNTELASLTDIE